MIASAEQLTTGLTYPFRAVWVSWRFDFELAVGQHQIRIRATDASSRTQPLEDATINDSVNAVTHVTVQAI